MLANSRQSAASVRKKAADIISYRDSHGGFKDVAELKEVHGIGDKTFETLAPQLTVGP